MEAGVEREESRDMAGREQTGRERDHGNGHSSSQGYRSGDNLTQESSTARSRGGTWRCCGGGRRDTVMASNAMANPRGGRPDPLSRTGDNDRGRLTPLTCEDILCLVREMASQLRTDNPQAALVPGMLLILQREKGVITLYITLQTSAV